MSYEPDQRYSADRSSRQEIDTAFSDKPSGDRGQFWNVDKHIQWRWIGSGLTVGLICSVFDPFDWNRNQLFDTHVGSILIAVAAYLALGAVVGLVAASIRRRFTGED